MNKYNIRLLAVAAMYFCNNVSYAIDLKDEFRKAQSFDPAFQTAKADYKSNSSLSSQSYASYLPSANISSQRIETDLHPRQTASISQPIFNLSLLAQFQQGSPRQAFAEVNLKVQEFAL